MLVGRRVRLEILFGGAGELRRILVMVTEGGSGGVGVVDFAGEIVRGHLVLK